MKKDSLRPLIRRSGASLHEGRRSERNKVHGRAEAVAASMTDDGPLPRPMSGYVGMRERRGHGAGAGRTGGPVCGKAAEARSGRRRQERGRPQTGRRDLRGTKKGAAGAAPCAEREKGNQALARPARKAWASSCIFRK